MRKESAAIKGKLLPLAMGLINLKEVQTVAHEFIAQTRLDILVNNAGL